MLSGESTETTGLWLLQWLILCTLVQPGCQKVEYEGVVFQDLPTNSISYQINNSISSKSEFEYSAIQISPDVYGPKRPIYLGSNRGSNTASEPEFATITQEQCPLQCDTECVSLVADKLMIVVGSTRQLNVASGSVIETARHLFSHACGEENIIYLFQPSKEQLRRSIEYFKQTLLGIIFIGHGFSEGLLLSDSPADYPYLLERNRGNLLVPAELHSYLTGSTVPHVHLLACDQGEQKQGWQDATHPYQLTFFDGAVSLDQVTTTLADIADGISCTRQKWSCAL
ncbi:MAG: hypothetical protein MJE77_24440 [Proteobacteria bacterium]|nr:hypothetical protein [Pseudomonadota bacterium]